MPGRELHPFHTAFQQGRRTAWGWPAFQVSSSCENITIHIVYFIKTSSVPCPATNPFIIKVNILQSGPPWFKKKNFFSICYNLYLESYYLVTMQICKIHSLIARATARTAELDFVAYLRAVFSFFNVLFVPLIPTRGNCCRKWLCVHQKSVRVISAFAAY